MTNYDEKQNQWAEMAELVDGVRREVERERERLIERVERMEVLLKITESADEMLSAIRERDERIAEQDIKMQEKDERLAQMEMQLSEMSKLSAGVAKKASQDELIKGLRTFVNISKRKSIDKRAHVKYMIMELSDAANLTMPEDLR